MKELIAYLLLILLTVFAGFGCATPQMMKERVDGGRIVVHGSRSIAAESGKDKAKAMMAQKCPKGYDIIETGQMTTGQSQVANMSFNETNLYYDFKCK